MSSDCDSGHVQGTTFEANLHHSLLQSGGTKNIVTCWGFLFFIWGWQLLPLIKLTCSSSSIQSVRSSIGVISVLPARLRQQEVRQPARQETSAQCHPLLPDDARPTHCTMTNTFLDFSKYTYQLIEIHDQIWTISDMQAQCQPLLPDDSHVTHWGVKNTLSNAEKYKYKESIASSQNMKLTFH